MTNPDHTDSPLAHPRHRPPAPKNLEALTAVARSIDVPFAFSHSTAAEIAGWPTPWAARVVGDLHVITETRAGHLKRTGFIGHRGLESRAVVLRHGLPIVAPAHTWADLGELVGRGLPYTFEDIIGAGDQALNAGCTKEQLRLIVESRIRPRGKRTLLPALPWMRRGSESMLETGTRLVVHRGGVPSASLNQNVYDSKGNFLFRPDLAWRAKRVAVECQGTEYHDTPDAVASDTRRFEVGKRHGWTFLEVRSDQIWDRDLRNEFLSALADALGFPAHRLDLPAAEPQRHSPEAAATLLENLERRRRRGRAQQSATRRP